ncbi:translation initiation factor IF-2-like isoform X2 [Manacus candei]|uniref:translation initiation factor IF-2-like isoform X2 n=1 Tax=Manacus candei TaxID=415023 RepID=UPI00222785E3|nr:translation initiation factor IF-2-like isoform X2 [Manacus candei]
MAGAGQGERGRGRRARAAPRPPPPPSAPGPGAARCLPRPARTPGPAASERSLSPSVPPAPLPLTGMRHRAHRGSAPHPLTALTGAGGNERRQGSLRWDRRRNFLLERVVRPWQGLPREVWSAQPWRCPRKAWPWHSVLWAGGQACRSPVRSEAAGWRCPGRSVTCPGQPLVPQSQWFVMSSFNVKVQSWYRTEEENRLS